MDSLADFKPHQLPPAANVGEFMRCDDDLEGIKTRLNEVFSQVEQLERKIHEIDQFYSKKHLIDCARNATLSLSLRDKDKVSHVTRSHTQQDRKAASDRMEAFSVKTQFQSRTTMNQEETIEEELLQEEFHAKMTRDIHYELDMVDTGLNNLRDLVLQRRRRMSRLEKRELGRALIQLSPDDLMKALEIVAQGNPTFQADVEEVDLDLNAQSESTLWRLKYFVVDILEAQAQAQGNHTSNGDDKNEKKENDKRKKETPEGVAKPPKKKSKKVGPTV